MLFNNKIPIFTTLKLKTMKTITLEIDNEASYIFDDLSVETKKQFISEVSQLLKDTAHSERSAKLKKLVHEINTRKDCANLNAEVLLELLPID